MLTQNEISSLSLSPTKKDFVQIWNELLEVAGKLSERWDPTSTNESDPGIVILKALTGIADKLNYNIDKNTLEAFMPTAAQEDSMRKLCDMLGYNMKYYRSAQTSVNIKYYNSDPSKEEAEILASPDALAIPKFTVITNSDQDISYFTINPTPVYISSTTASVPLDCMEGQIVKCESINDNNVITANQISENNRFYLPETQIAENGIFIYNVFDNSILGGTGLEDGIQWEKVDNLNVQVRNSRVYKFGFDSYEGRPYVEFPEDYSELFNDGIVIYYARTSGASGNVSAKTLTKLEAPTGAGWDKVSLESFSVENTFAATNGANLETIQQAYNSFKKTIGTFETLVTCRDYMNKIYSMISDNGKPLVSNILVTDIRNDLNRAVTICSCDDAGIFYKETPISLGMIEEGTELAKGAVYTTTSMSEPELISEELSEPLQVCDSEFSEPIQNGEPAFSEPETDTSETVTTYVASEVNKPYYSTSNFRINQLVIDSIDIQTGQGTTKWVERMTNWFTGEGSTKIALYADEYDGSNLVSKEDSATFDDRATGTVSAYDANGERSDVWLITQGDTTYRSALPIDWVASTTTTQTNIVTKTVNMLQTETVSYERTRTVNNQVTKTVTNTATDVATKKVSEARAINHFDLVLYPYKSYNQIKSNVKSVRKVYDASFEYDPSSYDRIKDDLEDSKTIAHNFVLPRINDIISINNYLRLNATIATTSKITIEEGELLKDKIKIALANAFNMRELDFGEEIPFDSIVDVIENADARIRVASLNEPAVYTTFSVYKADSNGVPVVKEYAIESDWLSLEEATEAGRFDINKIDANGNLVSTFNTDEAKEIYNKLAVRNILAGRVALFNYNDTFKPSFEEGAYQVKEELLSKPSSFDMPEPTDTNPSTICVKDGVTYVGEYGNPPRYYKIETPKAFLNEDDSVGTSLDVITAVENNAITDILTNCEIYAEATENGNVISDVTLEKGEFVKFRAENFVTTKTYPAYVNYHLALNTELRSEAVEAEADTLFNILNSDWSTWSTTNTDIKWQKVLDYFNNVDAQRGAKTKYVKTMPLRMPVSKFSIAAATSDDVCDSKENSTGQHVRDESTGKCSYCGKSVLSPIQTGPITVKVENDQETDGLEEVLELLSKSGCVKLANPNFKARLEWTDEYGDVIPKDSTGPDLEIVLDLSNPFITDSTTLSNLTENLTTRLNELVGQVDKNGNPMLPTECAWNIYFDFEAVPFDAPSFEEWKRFIKSSDKQELLGFTPATDGDILFWRVYGEGYSRGKFILQSTQKLLKFDSTNFTMYQEDPIANVYLVKTLGKDAEAAVITNGQEYRLGPGEYLYIEYTPSSSTEDGNTQELPPVTEVLGEGTIIKPSGFETGIIDSTVYASLGNSPHKTVTFKENNSLGTKVDMHRFGANEQVEIRDFARVVLNKDSFKTDSSGYIYYYKNFNDCEALEKLSYDKYGNRINNSYTLKDGEYVFYTDHNKSEFAYFTSGTEVTLAGEMVFDKFDVIDLVTVFESGVQAVPWKFKSFSKSDDSITFQEYQYVTLGPSDTLKSITLLGDTKLSSTWQACEDVSYTLAGSEDEMSLPEINVTVKTTSGNGWKVCSIFELDVNSSEAQTLRSPATEGEANAVKTSISLVSSSPSGVGGKSKPLEITAANSDHPLSFKTNLICQTSNSQLNINDIYSNPKKLKGFEFKIFATDKPAIVETEPNKVIPYHGNNITDLTIWPGEPIKAKDPADIWYSVNLEDIVAQDSSNEKDRALRLPVRVIPNTYGIFSIYLAYTNESDTLSEPKTWIEVLPGTDHKDITLLNVAERDIEWGEPTDNSANESDKLYLKPGINCIRVNKTSRLFIKSSIDALGTLYFDELKLVNYQTLSYTEGMDTISSFTQGLNLKQIGYLNPVNSAILDADARTELKDSYANDALLDIEEKTSEAEKEYQALYSEVLGVKPKLEKIASFIAEAKKELTGLQKLATSNPTSFTNLFQKYQELSDILDKEKDLLKELDNNKNIEDIEREFVTILNKFSTIEITQKQLLEELETLKARANTKIANIFEVSDDEINAYTYNKTNNVSQISDSLIHDEILNTCRRKVEAQFNRGLAAFNADIDKIVNEEERANLSTILEALHKTQITDNQAKIATKIKELVSASDSAELDSILETMYTNALEANYISLDASLAKLSTYLNRKNINSLITEIELIANEGTNTYLKDLIQEFKNVLRTSNKYDVETYTTFTGNSTSSGQSTKGIKGIQKLVANKHDAEDEDKTITAYVYTLYTDITNDYKTQLIELLDALYLATTDASGKITESGLLTSLSSDYEEVISRLQESTNEQVISILEKVKEACIERNSLLEAITTFDTLNNTTNPMAPIALTEYYKAYGPTLQGSLPFGAESVKEVFLDIMKKAFTEELDTLSITIYRSLDKLESCTIAPSDSFTDIIDEDAEFSALAEQVNALIQKNSQNASRKDLINTISDLLPESAELTAAMTALKDNQINTAIYNIITNIIENVQDSEKSVEEKQQWVKKLRDELDSSIQIDAQLVNTIADLLGPNILLFKDLPEAANSDSEIFDEFYAKLNTFVLAKQSMLSNKESLSTVIDNFTDLLDPTLLDLLNSTNSTEFKAFAKLLTSDSKNTFLLPDEHCAKLLDLKDLITIQDEASIVKDAYIFKILDNSHYAFEIESEDEDGPVILWVDKYGKTIDTSKANWVDLYGNKIQLKRTLEGKWYFIEDDFETYSIELDSIKDTENENIWMITVGSTTTAYTIQTSDLAQVLKTLLDRVIKLANAPKITDTFSNVYNVLAVEKLLLSDIRSMDTERDFYYTAPIDTSLAIDFNESDSTLNTLMNPAVNYDINNINNNFVISKLDIEYLDKGIQLARSSRIN